MKKRILAIAFVMLMFPLALLLTACGGGQLEVGKNYVYDKAEIVWGSNEEKDAFLSMSDMTEEEMLAGMTGSLAEASVVFNEDGTVDTIMGGEVEMTMYYVVEGNTVKVYQDAAKTTVSGEMQIVGNTLVQEQGLMPGEESATKIKIVYKVA